MPTSAAAGAPYSCVLAAQLRITSGRRRRKTPRQANDGCYPPVNFAQAPGGDHLDAKAGVAERRGPGTVPKNTSSSSCPSSRAPSSTAWSIASAPPRGSPHGTVTRTRMWGSYQLTPDRVWDILARCPTRCCEFSVGGSCSSPETRAFSIGGCGYESSCEPARRGHSTPVAAMVDSASMRHVSAIGWWRRRFSRASRKAPAGEPICWVSTESTFA